MATLSSPVKSHGLGLGLGVLERFNSSLANDGSEVSVAVTAIKTLIEVIQMSQATTMMGLERELRDATTTLRKANASFALISGCELFTKFVTRTADELPNFEECKRRVLTRGEGFLQMAAQCRHKISALADRFIRDGVVILTHGYSRVVTSVLQSAAKHKRFSVIVTESRPDNAGYKTVKKLAELGIPSTLIMDTGIGYAMEMVDLVLVGGEAVVENGGVLNKIGTYSLAVMAKALNRPFYVAAESFKFSRLYPLNQLDPSLTAARAIVEPVNIPVLPQGVKLDNPSIDYTPPSYISLLFTDLGVLTPSAVSDELIKLYC